MLSHTAVTALALAGLLGTAFAQTYTTCNPTEKTCSSDKGLSTRTYSVDFTSGESSDWNVTASSDRIAYSSSGAAFTVSASGDSPTIESNFYLFFGSVSVLLRAAPGTGIVSSAVLESDDLDEIDWEWIGGSAGEVQTNYFGKGNTTSYDRGKTISLDTTTQDAARNYTIDWTSKAITWYVDGAVVRTLAYADALGGKNYPQTPMRVRLGLWAGGDSGNPEGTITWAGGETDYTDGPFTMYVERVDITNYNPGTSYTYGDTSGDWTSIQVEGGESNEVSSSSTGSHVSAASTSSTSKSSKSTTVSASLGTATVEPSTGSTSGKSANSTLSSSSSASTTTTAGGGSASVTSRLSSSAGISLITSNPDVWIIALLIASFLI